MLVASILAALAAILLVVIAAYLFRKIGKDDDEPDGATSAHAGAMLSALFLLIFAIALIVPWTTSDSARQNTYAEAQAITEASWAAGGLPDADRAQVRAGLRDYTDFVMNKEWADLHKGRLDNAGWAKLDTLREQINGFNLTTKDQQDTQGDVLDQIQNLYAARRQRAVDAKATLPTGVLMFTVLTGVIMIVFPFLAGARPRRMAKVPLVVMAGLLGISMYLVFDINHTFSGALAVKKDAYRSALQELQRIPAGG